MNNNTIKSIIYILIAIGLAVIAISFVLWLLPIILVLVLAYFIYQSIKRKVPIKEGKVLKGNKTKKF